MLFRSEIYTTHNTLSLHDALPILFMGMPASGKRVDVQLIDIIRFGDDGLAHEHWGVFDALAMMQQLGAIPGPPPA